MTPLIDFKTSLKDRVALVTGAGSGIGKGAALILAAAGARVLGISRTREEVERTVQEITQAGGEAIAFPGDISTPADLESAVTEVEKRWGRLDIVIANAGINGTWAPIEELTVDNWNTTIAINLSGTFFTIKSAARLLKRQGGSVIITSSVNGTRMFSNTGATAYSCSKAGQVALAKMLALELAREKIRVNVLCPGAITTHIEESTKHIHLEGLRPRVVYPEGSIPLKDGKPGSVEEVANLIWFLASDLASHISGTEIFIDGAESLLMG